MGGQGHELVAAVGGVAPAVAAALETIAAGEAVVLAVSGGPDSMVMADTVAAVRPDLVCTVAHVRHGLRDDAADAAAAGAMARRLGVVAAELTITVAATRGVEADARHARYAALAEHAADIGASWVLVAHTADDQAETVLLNIARGSGVAGAAGMPMSRPLGQATLLRPLLRVRRAAVRTMAQTLRDDGVPIVDDPMNSDVARRRTRARHVVLPALAELTGGATDPVVALTRLAAAATADEEALSGLARDQVDTEGRRWGPVRAFPYDVLSALPWALSSRIVRLLARRHDVEAGGTPQLPTWAQVERILALRPGHSAPLPAGVVAGRSLGWLTVAPTASAPAWARSLDAAVTLDDIGIRVERQRDPVAGLLPFWAPDGAAGVVPAPSGDVEVRTCRRDDVIMTRRPRRLASAVRAIVPAAARPFVVVLADPDGPVWVPGVAVRAGLTDVGAGHLRLVASGPARRRT